MEDIFSRAELGRNSKDNFAMPCTTLYSKDKRNNFILNVHISYMSLFEYW